MQYILDRQEKSAVLRNDREMLLKARDDDTDADGISGADGAPHMGETDSPHKPYPGRNVNGDTFPDTFAPHDVAPGGITGVNGSTGVPFGLPGVNTSAAAAAAAGYGGGANGLQQHPLQQPESAGRQGGVKALCVCCFLLLTYNPKSEARPPQA